MKKYLSFFVAIGLSLSILVACNSSASTSDTEAYNKLKSDYDDLSERYTALQENFSSLQKEYDKVVSESLNNDSSEINNPSEETEASQIGSDSEDSTTSNISGIEYDSGPFTLHKYLAYDTTSALSTCDVDSFLFTDISYYSDGDYMLTFELKGLLIYCCSEANLFPITFYLHCYDSEGYFIGSTTIIEKATLGENFKITDTCTIPAGTIKIEISETAS